MTPIADHVSNDLDRKLAEHRLDWERIEGRIEAGLDHEPSTTASEHHLGPYVTVSSMTGTGGSRFARQLAESLGWPALGSEIVDRIADTFKLDSTALHALDEAKANWVRDLLGELMPHQVINTDAYIRYLGKVMRLIGLHGNVVLIGRGAHFFLPRKRGVSVRMVAPADDRVRWLAARNGMDEAEARKHMDEEDRRRACFSEHYFGQDVGNPTLFDLVLNRSTLSDDEMLESVLTVCRRRGYHS
jgi:cytidylate kinase